MEICLQLSLCNHRPYVLFTVLLASFVQVCKSTFLKLDLLSSARIYSTRMLPQCSPVSSASAIVTGVSISRLLTGAWLARANKWISITCWRVWFTLRYYLCSSSTSATSVDLQFLLLLFCVCFVVFIFRFGL
jgi:hypothetical protein